MTDIYPGEKTVQADQEQARIEALASIARQVARLHGAEHIFEYIALTAKEVLHADLAIIALREADGEHIKVVAQAGVGGSQRGDIRGARFHLPRFPLATLVFGDRQSVIVSDSLTGSEFGESEVLRPPGSRSFAITPLREAEKVIGALSVSFTHDPHEWTDREIDWLHALGDQTALAVILGRTMQSQQRDIAVREALHTASQRLQSAADLHTVIQATMEGVKQVVPSIGVAVHLLNGENTEATIAGLLGFAQVDGDIDKVLGFTYPADDSSLNSRTLLEHEAFFLRDFQVEADRWANSHAPTLRSWMSVPLMSSGRCLGKITVDHDLPNLYGPDEVAIVQTFAAHAASAIERAYLYAEATRRADQLAALHQISQQLVGTRDETSLYEILRRWVMQTFAADVFFVSLASTENDRLYFPILVDEGIDYAPKVLGPSPGPAGEVLRTSKPLLLRGRPDWEKYGARLIGNESRRSEAAIFAPLIWSGQTLGVMSVQTYQDQAYTQDEFQAFQSLAASAALALGRIRSEAASAERATQFAALAQSARALVSNLEVSDVLQSVVDRANELTGGEAFLMLYNPDDDLISVQTFAGTSPWHEVMRTKATLRPGQGVGGAAFAGQQTIVVQDMQSDQRAMYREVTPMRSLVVLPLTVGDNRMGILELAWPEPEAVTQDRLALCTAFADHAALAIHNARQHEELRKREAERTTLLRQVLTAQEAERKRVSIELHDGPLQSLGVGLINADTLRKKAEQGQLATQDIDSLRLDFAAVVDEIRDLMADLRPEVLDSYGLLPALDAHARRIGETTQLGISIECNLKDRLPPYMEVLIYRLVQESLTNVRKHAQASSARVSILLDEGRRLVTVRISDDGRGFNPKRMPARTEGYGLGLSSMAERAESAGGKMNIESAPGQPTTVIFLLPLPMRDQGGTPINFPYKPGKPQW